MDVTTPTSARATARPAGSQTTDLLLLGGAVAGPLYAVVAAVQAVTRDGFDLAHHPLSLLSLGPLGWVQIANFVVAGVLSLGLAAGARRVLAEGPGRTWGPLLIGVYGAGLVAGGVFVPDPALGFPPGTPDTIPSDLTWHGLAHAVAPPLAFTALVACCFVLARRFGAEGSRGWAVYSAGSGVAALVLSAWPAQDGASVRLAVALAVGFCWTTLLALRLRGPAQPPSGPAAPGRER